jgi:NADH-quinone oxidoreductase subunit E
MTLTPEEKREIAEEQKRYPDRRAACVEALKIAQRSRGWISDETLRELAAHLGMTADELDGVATFYNMIFRRPVGRHVIFLCDSVSCWVMGEEALRARLKKRLGIDFGQTTPDGEYTLLPVACLGACDHAPALLLDRELHGDLTEEELDALIEGRRG